LDELPPAQRSEFEAHFFDCRECASELRVTAAFLDISRQELRRGKLVSAASRVVKRSWRELLARPAVLTPAFGLLLAVIAYQNSVVLPRFNGQIARLSRPGVVATVSLIGGNSRGDAPPPISGPAGQPILLSFDIPAIRPYPGYVCVLLDAAGTVVWRVPVSPAQAQDTVSISVPAGALRAGDYALVVRGLQTQERGDGANPQGAELAHYRFILSPSP
jgi:hypothetical protein